MVLGTMLLGRFGQLFDKHKLIEKGLFVVAVTLTILGIVRPVVNFLTRPGRGLFQAHAQRQSPASSPSSCSRR